MTGQSESKLVPMTPGEIVGILEEESGEGWEIEDTPEKLVDVAFTLMYTHGLTDAETLSVLSLTTTAIRREYGD